MGLAPIILIIMLACHCGLDFGHVDQYNKHQMIHSNDTNLSILCKYPGCGSRSKSYIAFKKHILRSHKNSCDEFFYGCKYDSCSFKCESVSVLKKHYNELHVIKIGDEITCPFCHPKIKNLSQSSYQSHVSRFHNDLHETHQLSFKDSPADDESFQSRVQCVDDSNEQMAPIEDISVEISKTNMEREHSVSCDAQMTDDTEPIIVPTSQDDMTKSLPIQNDDSSANKTCIKIYDVVRSHDFKQEIIQKYAKNLITLTAEKFVNEPSIQMIVDDNCMIFDRCKEQFLGSLASSNLCTDDKNLVSNMFDDSFSLFPDMFHPKTGCFRSKHCREKYFDENFDYIPPVKIYLHNSSGLETESYYSYVPVKETLTTMLKDENIRKHCTHSYRDNDGIGGFFDIKDGRIIRDTDYFQQDNILYLGISQDAFEVCNPCGTHKKVHKMIGCYLTLLNLPPYLRSRVKNIKLVFLCKEKDQRDHGWREVLKVLINDLKDLETVGITIDTDEGPINFKCGLVAVFGDNLGSHGIGGYVEAFSALIKFICRYCDMSFDEFLENPTKVRPLRTVDEYAASAAEAEETNTIVNGIKVNSSLNDYSEVYHVSKPGLPPCIDHDGYEGFVAYDLWLCIDYLVKEKYFDIDILNIRLNAFRFDGETKIKIPKIDLRRLKGKQLKLSGTASQMKRVVTILPLVVADLMKESTSDATDDVWEMIILMKEICLTLSAPSLSLGQMILFRNACEKYLKLRVKCFSDVPLRPKHKYLMHYFDLMLCFGPLKHSSTLRFEAKHFYFQSGAKHQKNYKSLTQTLAEKHERLQSINDDYCDEIREPTKIKKFVSNDYDPQISSEVIKYAEAHGMNEINVSEQITFRGVTYKKGMAVCVGKSVYGNYMICKIELIVVNKDHPDISFVGNTDEIVLFEELGVYEFVKYKEEGKSCSVLSAFSYSSLLSAEPLMQTTVKSVPVLQPKHVPFDPDL